jgi:hypothetical protein
MAIFTNIRWSFWVLNAKISAPQQPLRRRPQAAVLGVFLIFAIFGLSPYVALSRVTARMNRS